MESTRRNNSAEHGKYPTKLDCFTQLLATLDKYDSSKMATFNHNINYARDLNSWMFSTSYVSSTIKTTDIPAGGEGARASVVRTLRWNTDEGPLEFSSYIVGSSVAQANNASAWKMFRNIRYRGEKFFTSYTPEFIQGKVDSKLSLPRVQMDKLNEQGETTQESEKSVNTIITRDEDQSISAHSGVVVPISKYTSSEPTHKFQIVERYMPLAEFTVSINHTMGTLLRTYYLPEAVYSSANCSPNLIPFEAFVYGRLKMDILLKINANKFHCGKLLMSSKYNSYQADDMQNGYQAALSRNHVIVDMTANNEGVLEIPFRFYRPFLRLVKNDSNSLGVRPSKYASVYIHVLSPLQTGPEGASEISARLFYRITQAEFTGMSYRAKVQMLGLENILTSKTQKSLKQVLIGAEKAIDCLGSTPNRDKPGVVNATIVVPKPRLNFATGKGTIDVNSLSINPYTCTNYKDVPLPDDEPRTFYDVARIWGVFKEISWSSQDPADKKLATITIDPCLRNYDRDYVGEPTPLEYAVSPFQFWSGVIELRFDFVSNSFHTGSIMVSAEYLRTSTSETLCESASTYTKTFHLGEQKSFTFKVPYIYDTIFRRSTANVINPYGGISTSDGLKSRALTIAPESKTIITVRVINALRPVASAPQEIKCLVFMRAGKNFCMHGIKGASMIPEGQNNLYDNFPNNYQPVEVAPGGRSKRDVKDVELELVKSGKLLPKAIRNEWNEKKPEYVGKMIPRVQMDTGEKEDHDTTDDFQNGLANLQVQTLDCHMDFKDLLRRPTLLLHKIVIKPSDDLSPYFIPLSPPNKDMVRMAGSKPPIKDFQYLLGQTTSLQITQLFRTWRGKQRYTFVIFSGTKPIFVSLIPHSGVRILGSMPIVKATEMVGVNLRNVPIYGAGFISEIIVPTVNPTSVIEVPYDTENIWTLMADDDPSRNYSWRDKGDYNAGHLAITVEEEVTMSVFWSAGDDFELGSFYGMPQSKDNGWAYRFNDTHAKVQMGEESDYIPIFQLGKHGKEFPRTQMDFINEESCTLVRGLSKLVSTKNATRLALGCVPVIGGGLVTATAINELSDHVIPQVSDACSKVAGLAKTMDSTIGEVKNMIEQAVNTVLSSVGALSSYAHTFYDLMLDVIMAWMEQSWKVVGVGIVRFLSNVWGLDCLGTLSSWGIKLGEYIRKFMSPVAKVQAPVDPTATLVSILVGIVGTLTGVAMDSRRTKPIPIALVERLCSSGGISYLVGVLRYVQAIFGYVKDLILQALGYVSPEAAALKMLSEKSEIMNEFIREAQIVSSEACAAMWNNAAFRMRCWKTIMLAYQFQRLVCLAPPNACNAQFAKLCQDLIKLGKEKFCDISASPVRFETFMLCIEGPEGVGKSFVSEEIVCAMLKAIGFTCPSTSSIYFRKAGAKFWSGYSNQPAIVYDEVYNSLDKEVNSQTIIELQQIKSTSLFIPDMASLEEKKIHGNPLICVLLCNGAFPNMADFARYPGALQRRRDIVLHCDRNAQYKDVDLRELPREELKTMPHLEFQLYKNSKVASSLSPHKRSYTDTLEYIVNRFKRYFAQETILVQERTDRALAHLQNPDVNEIKLQDPFSLFYQVNSRIRMDPTLSQNGYTPFEELETAVAALVDRVENLPPPTPPEYPDRMEWEDPQVQGVLEAAAWAGGVITGAKWWTKIYHASTEKLHEWEMRLKSMYAKPQTCNICLESVPCAYQCLQSIRSENPHVICVSCYTSSVAYGLRRCSVCRCPTVLPYVKPETMQAMGVFSKFVINGLWDIRQCITSIVKFFRMEGNNIMVMTAFILSVVALLDSSLASVAEPATNYISGYTIARSMTLLGSLDANVQVEDDWDEEQPSCSSQVTTLYQKLNPTLNMEHFNHLLEGTHQPMCLHGDLFDNWETVVLVGDKWRMGDAFTRSNIEVSMYACSNNPACPARSDAYRSKLKTYIAVQEKELRSSIIQYFNDPNPNNQKKVPLIFQPDWMIKMEVIEIGPSWWEWLSNVWSKYGLTLTAIAGVMGITGYMMNLYSFSSNLLMVQSSEQYDPGASARHRKYEVRSGSTRKYFQASGDTPTPYEVARKYVVKNTFTITIVKSNSKQIKMYGVGLFNHFLLLPKHYVKEIKKARAESLSIFGENFGQPQLRGLLNLSDRDIIESNEADIALINLPPSFPLFKDIRKFIAHEDDFVRSKIPSDGCLLAVPERNTDFMTEVFVDIKGIDNNQIILDQDDNSFVANDVVVYNFSRPGACGSLLFREHHTRPIIAMHFAGIGERLTGEGYGVLLSCERLSNMSEDSISQKEELDLGTLEDAKMVVDDAARVQYLGTVEAEKIPYIPTKTKLRKSLIYGVPKLSTVMAPAILHKNDPRYIHDSSPLYEGIRKHGILTNDFPSDMIDMAKNILWDGWFANLKPVLASPVKLTVEQAVVGFTNDFYGGMDLNTSAGYPYVLTGKMSKSDYISVKRNTQNQIIEVESLHPLLQSELKRKSDLRLNGIVPSTIFIDTLKDEKRKSEKLMAKGGTRVFCNPGVDFVIDCRRNLLHFMAAFMKNRHNLMHGVGINACSSEWGVLLKSLVKVNTKFITIDYSNFGPGYNAGVARAFFEIMIDWTMANVKDSNRKELECIMYECIHSTHIANNTVYNQVGGSPSGAPVTTVLNSGVNMLYLMLAWISLCKDYCIKKNKGICDEFQNNVCLRVYGDDAIMTVSDEYLPLFNGKTIHKFFSAYNIVNTSANKTAEIKEWEHLSEASFLKRKFKKHPYRIGEWLSPLDEESIKSTTQWIWASPDLKGSTRVNCEAALLQAHGHGKEYYDNLKSTVNLELAKRKIPPITRTWEEIDEIYFDTGIDMNKCL